MAGEGHPKGMKLYEGSDVRVITEYIVKNQQLMLENLKREERRQRDVVSLPYMPQLRTTRRIESSYVLTKNDCYNHVDDSIGVVCDSGRLNELYELPLRMLYHDEYDNMLTAGRSAGAAGAAWDFVRLIPQAIVTGQAAGCIAALAVKEGVVVRELKNSVYQPVLEEAGVIIHYPEEMRSTSNSALVGTDHF